MTLLDDAMDPRHDRLDADDVLRALGGDAVLQATVDMVSAYVGGNAVPARELPGLVRSVHGVIMDLAREARRPGPPAMRIR